MKKIKWYQYPLIFWKGYWTVLKEEKEISSAIKKDGLKEYLNKYTK